MTSEKKDANVTRDCRFIDHRRRTVIPQGVLDDAGVYPCSMIEWSVLNGCVVGAPVVGIVVKSHTAANKTVKKGRG